MTVAWIFAVLYGVACIAGGAIALHDALDARREMRVARRPQPLPRAEVRR